MSILRSISFTQIVTPSMDAHMHNRSGDDVKHGNKNSGLVSSLDIIKFVDTMAIRRPHFELNFFHGVERRLNALNTSPFLSSHWDSFDDREPVNFTSCCSSYSDLT